MSMSAIGSIVGGIAGGILTGGNPAGIATGASLGGSVGGAASSLTDSGGGTSNVSKAASLLSGTTGASSSLQPDSVLQPSGGNMVTGRPTAILDVSNRLQQDAQTQQGVAQLAPRAVPQQVQQVASPVQIARATTPQVPATQVPATEPAPVSPLKTAQGTAVGGTVATVPTGQPLGASGTQGSLNDLYGAPMASTGGMLGNSGASTGGLNELYDNGTLGNGIFGDYGWKNFESDLSTLGQMALQAKALQQRNKKGEGKTLIVNPGRSSVGLSRPGAVRGNFRYLRQ